MKKAMRAMYIGTAILTISLLGGCSAVGNSGAVDSKRPADLSSATRSESGEGQSMAESNTPGETTSLSSALSGESAEADAVMANFGSIGNEYTLHSRYYQQGEAKVEVAPNLGWDGDLLLTVKSAQVQEYSAADDDNGDPARAAWATYAKLFSDPCVLKLDMTLTNKDAENKNGVRYLFNAGMFRLAAYEDLIPDNWKNAETYVSIGEQYSALEAQFDKHSDNDDYWSFTLEPEETLDFTLQFLIDRKYLEQNTPFLAVSFGRQIECGVLLDKIE